MGMCTLIKLTLRVGEGGQAYGQDECESGEKSKRSCDGRLHDDEERKRERANVNSGEWRMPNAEW